MDIVDFVLREERRYAKRVARDNRRWAREMRRMRRKWHPLFPSAWDAR